MVESQEIRKCCYCTQVYEDIQKELTNFEGTQISLLETSHRSQTYMKLNTEIQNVVRRLL